MDDHGPSLRVERFDYARVGSEWAVLRLLAALQRAPGAVHVAVELAGAGSDRVYAPARACDLERRLGAGGDELLWRAAFALPLDVVQAPAAGFSLVWADGQPELALSAPRLRTLDPRLLVLAQRPTEGGGLTLGAARRRLAALATAVAVTTTSAPAAAFAATRGRPAVGHSGTRGAHGRQEPPAAPSATTIVTAAVAAPPSTTTVTGAVTAPPAATPAPATPASTTPAAPAASTPAAPATTSRTPGRLVVATVTTADARGPRADARAPKVTRVFSAPSRPAGEATTVSTGGTTAPRGATHHTGTPPTHHTGTAPTHHTGTAPTHHTGTTPAHHTGTAPAHHAGTRAHHTGAPHPTLPAPIHPSGGAALAPQPLPSVPAPSSGGLTPGAPGFTGPTSWTGSVAPDPGLTGSVTNLAGLASDAYRPPSFLIPIYMQAGHRYGIPWTVLAAINSVESDYGRNLNTSSAGAVGWMQFEPGTWHEYGLAVDGHSVPNPYDPRDAIFSAARYLAAAGGATDIARAVYAYNHASWYVNEVLARASAIAHHAQYEHAAIRHGTFSVDFATGRRHPTVRYRGGVMSHYDRLISAANMVSAANFPYLYGGGHEQPARFGPFDCSGSVSYVVQQAGYKVPTTVSGEIPVWRFPAGPGRVTIFYNPVHTFMRIGNRYFGTSGFARGSGGGAGWFDVNRLPAGYLSQFREVHLPRLGVNSFAPGSPATAGRGSSTPPGARFAAKRLSTLGSFPAAD